MRNVLEVLNHKSSVATVHLGKISFFFHTFECKMIEGIEFQGKNMKSESVPSIIHSFIVGKKC